MLSNIRQLINRSASRGMHNTYGALRLRKAMLQRATWKKNLNFLSIKIQKRMKREVITAKPYRYKIDPTNVCQLRCPLCPTGLNQTFRQKGFMKISDFHKIIDQIAPHALVLDLFGWGEPILHPNLNEMIQYASDKGIFVRTSSTFEKISQEQMDQLIEAGLDAIIVAIDGSDAETHGLLRVGSDWARVTENIRYLMKAKQQKGASGPHVTVRMLINKHNENQIDAVRNLATDLGVDSFTVGAIAINTCDESQASQWLPLHSKITAYGAVRKNKGSCSDLWESMVINFDGGVPPCCWQYHESTDIGNCCHSTIDEIWNSPSMVSARRLVLGKDVPKEFEDIVCGQCQGYPDYLVP